MITRFPSLGLRDPAFLQGGVVYPETDITTDDGDDYSAGEISSNTLEGGTVNPAYPWNGRWILRTGFIGPQAQDNWEDYTNGDGINGKTGGIGEWNGAWVNR